MTAYESMTKGELLEVPLSSLAYVGDAVYELAVRERLLRRAKSSSRKLYLEAIHFVEAGAQARALKALQPELTEEETALCRRARNHSPGSRPRHADPKDYRYATALEALCGWLWLKGDHARLEYLLTRILLFCEAPEGRENEVEEDEKHE